MTDADEADYYADRERQERARAGAAADPAVAAIHADMAERYSRLIRPVVAAAAARPTLRLV